MKIALFGMLPFALLVAVPFARAADDESLERMALCRDSWFEWQKSDPARLSSFAEHVRSAFSPDKSNPFLVPKSGVTIDGLRVTQLFPDSVGMGVGISLTVDAPFDETKKKLEAALGRPLSKCEASDNMRSCELKISDKRTVMLIAEDSPKAATSLVGCYYFYEK
jgi:hypothetical protein